MAKAKPKRGFPKSARIAAAETNKVRFRIMGDIIKLSRYLQEPNVATYNRLRKHGVKELSKLLDQYQKLAAGKEAHDAEHLPQAAADATENVVDRLKKSEEAFKFALDANNRAAVRTINKVDEVSNVLLEVIDSIGGMSIDLIKFVLKAATDKLHEAVHKAND